MTQSVLERASEHIAESARQASRTTTAVADTIEDGVGAAIRSGELICDVTLMSLISNLETFTSTLVLAFAMSADHYSAGCGYHQPYCWQENQRMSQHQITSIYC